MSYSAGTTPTKDWRLDLLGPIIRLNKSVDEEAPSPAITVDTIEATTKESYDYIAILFVANYCPHCKLFAPEVVKQAAALEEKKCKVIVCTNDRDEEDYAASCEKVRGLDILPWDTDRTQRLRDLFKLKTIPALMILENDNFDQENPRVVSNARAILEQDPKLAGFPWDPADLIKISAWDRIFINGKYGKWYNLGHRNVSQNHPEEMYMDEHTVRIRAGLLNIVTWFALINIFLWREQLVIKIAFPIIAWEFLTSALFGMTPFAPLGFIASILAVVLQPQPHWKPAGPKRFAWAIGLVLATSCFVSWYFRANIGANYQAVVGGFILLCNVFTWLESAAGFCFGCFVYNSYLVPIMGYEECSDCKI